MRGGKTRKGERRKGGEGREGRDRGKDGRDGNEGGEGGRGSEGKDGVRTREGKGLKPPPRSQLSGYVTGIYRCSSYYFRGFLALAYTSLLTIISTAISSPETVQTTFKTFLHCYGNFFLTKKAIESRPASLRRFFET
jgi:hypothetical protein